MFDGVAKSFEGEKTFTFVGIQNHCNNLAKIVDAFRPDFVGKENLLKQAALKHDLWKFSTMDPRALFNRNTNLFYGHGSEFPSYLISDDFDEIEFDKEERIKHFSEYYVLKLIRLHHSHFGTSVLFRETDFIYESSEIKKNIQDFIRDWYALKIADWIDSQLMECVLGMEEIPSLIDLGLRAEIDIGFLGENEYCVFPSEFLIKDVELEYQYIKIDKEAVQKIVNDKRIRNKRNELNRIFREEEKEIAEVILRGGERSL